MVLQIDLPGVESAEIGPLLEFASGNQFFPIVIP
jgi:hypothetical protein